MLEVAGGIVLGFVLLSVLAFAGLIVLAWLEEIACYTIAAAVAIALASCLFGFQNVLSVLLAPLALLSAMGG